MGLHNGAITEESTIFQMGTVKQGDLCSSPEIRGPDRAQRRSVKLRSLPTVLTCGDALTSGHSRWNAAQNAQARTHSKCVIF